MTEISRDTLWQRLRAAALVDGEMPAAKEPGAPWFVRVMLGTAGWIGALFLLGFVGVGLAFVFRSATIAIVAGLMACTAAYAIFRTARDNVFAAQFALAVSFAGQAMFAFGVFDALRGSGAGGWFLLAAFEAALAIAMASFLHRVWSALAAVVALSLAMSSLGVHQLVPGAAAAAFAIVWLNESDWTPHGALVRPIGYGLALGLLQVDAQILWGGLGALVGPRGAAPWAHGVGQWLGAALVALAFVCAVWRVLQREGVTSGSRAGAGLLAGAVLLMVATLPAPGLAAALLVVLLGFANGNRPLVGLGLFGLAAYLSHYYYELQTTLLVKSIVLAATACVLLAIRYAVLHWLMPAGAEAKDA